MTELLSFVGARLEEDRRGLDPAAPDGAHTDDCDLVEQLLEVAAGTCHPDYPCLLPDEHIAALALFAVLHEGHPDFNPAWMGRIAGMLEH